MSCVRGRKQERNSFKQYMLSPHAMFHLSPYQFRILSPYPFRSAFYPHIRSAFNPHIRPAFYPHIRSVPYPHPHFNLTQLLQLQCSPHFLHKMNSLPYKSKVLVKVLVVPSTVPKKKKAPHCKKCKRPMLGHPRGKCPS